LPADRGGAGATSLPTGLYDGSDPRYGLRVPTLAQKPGSKRALLPGQRQLYFPILADIDAP